jgi:hypothetical protein
MFWSAAMRLPGLRFVLTLVVSLCLLSLPWAAAPPTFTASQLRNRPITKADGELGGLLKKWWKEGTAAGNVGDYYDNRDGGHSDLNTEPYPQLQRIVYTKDDIDKRRNWAMAVTLRPSVTFGNSSTSAGPTQGGSNVRSYYCNPNGLPFLYRQYRANNVYIYPEHRDHDPGHNGKGDGYGDLYPANSPYLITSQGSSGSDQPFMQALPVTLAAFRPDVKTKLIQTGLLMPTIQMIFRTSNRHLAKPEEYLTGKAHPSVFEGSWVDSLRMARTAHDILLDDIPPMVQMKVVEEEIAVPNRDFCEPQGFTERMADTPAVIARIWRGNAYRRRMVVSAKGSFDVNKRPLTFKWAVLRGDPKRVKIKPLNKAGSRVEITVQYQPRRPISPGADMDSNRVDIGAFVHNGKYFSAPGFITWFTLDSESRTFDKKGRLLEIGHGMGDTTLTVADYGKLFGVLAGKGPVAKLLKLSDAQRPALGQASVAIAPLRAKAQAAALLKQMAEKQLQKADAAFRAAGVTLGMSEHDKREKLETDLTQAALARGKAEAELSLATEADNAAKAEVTRIVNSGKLDMRPRVVVDRALRDALANPDLVNGLEMVDLLAKVSVSAKKDVAAARKLIVSLGVATKGLDGRLEIRSVRSGSGPLEERLTPYERMVLERFNATLLTKFLLPGLVTSNFQENFVDPRLSIPKAWRDVYQYDPAGRLMGWIRYGGNAPRKFTPDGLLVVAVDQKGLPSKVRTVVYQMDGPFSWNPRPVKEVMGDRILHVEWVDGSPRVKRVEKLESNKK